MWMLVFTLLPLSALAYISWHVWCLLPLGWLWKVLILALMTGAFLLMFAGIMRSTDRMPMPLAIAVYEVGTSSIFILLYLFMLFLVLDLGRLFHLVPRTLLYNNWWTAGGIARSELHRWVDLINAEQPDLILIAGDIIDGSMRPLIDQQMHEEFRRLKAPVYVCIGNHEYYSGEPRARQFYQDAGIRLLQDSCVTIGDLCLIGRDDRSNFRRDSLGVLMKKADRSKYCILLDHQPYHLDQAERQQIDFQFSGHTHHGQVWPISWITEHVYECAFGPYQRGSTHYYITSGLGIWGGKFRIGTRSEYVVMILTGSH